MSKCKHCRKEYEKTRRGYYEDYCDECADLNEEQDKRCAEMERKCMDDPNYDEPLSWKEFEQDIMGLDFS